MTTSIDQYTQLRGVAHMPVACCDNTMMALTGSGLSNNPVIDGYTTNDRPSRLPCSLSPRQL